MPVLGQPRHVDRARLTSGLPRLADILRVIRHVSKVPLSDIRTAANGIDALTTNHDPVKPFRWNKPTKQRGLVDEIVFIAPRKHNETDA
jgi:hypothetical protein